MRGGKMILLLAIAAVFAVGASAFAFEMAPLSEAFLSHVDDVAKKSAVERRYGYTPSPIDLSHLREADYSGYFIGGRGATAYPAKYDPRALGIVPPVRNQGSYGTCWAFATIGALESSYMQSNRTGIKLSEMYLSWFAFNGPYSYLSNNPADILNSGGWVNTAITTFARWLGPTLSEHLPYPTEPDRMARAYPNALHLQNAFYVSLKGMHSELQPGEDVEIGDGDKMSDEMRKELLLRYGGIAVAFHAMSWEKYNEATYAWYNDEDLAADHEVLIVGWDDDFPKESFLNPPPRDGAWLVKNSWGTGWGDGGFFWLSYADPSLEEGTALLAEEPDNYDRNYGYDDLGWCRAMQYGSNPLVGRMANVFRAVSPEETLEAISFYTTTVGTRYELRIYTDLTDAGNPTSGKMAHSQSGVQDFAGYHTVPLSAPVSLSAERPFAVVLTLENPDYKYPLAVEAYVKKYSENAYALRGQSFFSSDGISWRDSVDIADEKGVGSMNACIRAFTSLTSEESPPVAFPANAAEWRVAVERHSDGSGVAARLYVPLKIARTPDEIVLDIRGIEVEDVRVRDSRLVVEGRAANEAAVRNAAIRSIAYKLGGLEIVQDLWGEREIEVGKMQDEPTETSGSSSGCSAGALWLPLLIPTWVCIRTVRRKK